MEDAMPCRARGPECECGMNDHRTVCRKPRKHQQRCTPCRCTACADDRQESATPSASAPGLGLKPAAVPRPHSAAPHCSPRLRHGCQQPHTSCGGDFGAARRGARPRLLPRAQGRVVRLGSAGAAGWGSQKPSEARLARWNGARPPARPRRLRALPPCAVAAHRAASLRRCLPPAGTRCVP